MKTGPRRLRWILLSIVAAATVLALWVFRPDRAARAGAGLTAHGLCSAMFVSGRDPDATFRDLVAPLMGGAAHAVRYTVDRGERRVTARFAGVVTARARFTPGYGCRLEDAANTPFPPATPTGPGPDGAPVTAHDAGIARALDGVFAEHGGAPLKRVQAVVVMRDGRIIAERYAPGVGPATPMLSWSTAKSLTNTLLGILVRQTRLRVSQDAVAPEWGPDDPRRRITIEQLLRMTSGLDAPETGEGTDAVTRMLYGHADMAAFAARHPLRSMPGTEWDYTSINTLLLNRRIGQAVGGGAAGLRGFAERELFAPLGIRDATLEFDGAGTFIGSSYAYMSARSFARLGELYRNDGVTAAGQRILPAGWADWSRRSTLGRGYGAGFWTNDGGGELARGRIAKGFPADGFYASGNMGQRIYIVPSGGLVIARFGYSSPPDFGIDDDIALVAAALRR